MQMLVFFSDSVCESALLKATTTKSIFVPAYTRSDGVVVPGHSKIVHYDPDKGVGSVLTGKGSHSQKAALKKLQKLEHWHMLAADEQHAHVLSSATNIQNKASTAASLSGWKKSALAGKNPTLSQWKAFDTLAPEDKHKQYALVSGAGGDIKHVNGPEGLVPTTLASAGVADIIEAPAAVGDSSLKDAAAAVTSPDASTNPWTDDQWSQLYLSDTNSNAPSHNKKIDALKNAADSGDVVAIQAMKFGSNTYAKKQAKIAEHLIAELGAKPAGAQALDDFSEKHEKIKTLVGWLEAATAGNNPTSEQWAAYQTLDQKDKLSNMKTVQKLAGGINHLDPDAPAGKPGSDAPAGMWGFEKEDEDFSGLPTLSLSGKDTTVHLVYDPIDKVYDVLVFDFSSNDTLDTTSIHDAALAHLAAHDAAVKNGIEPPPVSDFMQLSGEGPKEGDMQSLNGISYVLKNGRWHRVGEDDEEEGAAAPEPFYAPSQQTYSDQYQLHYTDGKSNKFYNAHVDGNSLVVSWGKVGTNGQTQVKEFHSAKVAHKELSNKLAEKHAKGYLTAEIAKAQTFSMVEAPAASATKSADLIDVAPHSPHASADGYKYADVSGWAKIGDQKGSNDGGVFKDKLGGKWYVKFPGSADIAKSEFMATKLYQMFGFPVPKSKLITKNGKIGIASKWDETLSKGSAEKLAKAKGARAGFVIDAWLANWDVVGLDLDNLLLNDKGEAVRLDNGGALAYRAMGGKKGSAFGRDVPELDTLLDPSKNATSATVFKGIKKSDLKAGAELLAKIKPSQIDEICEKVAIGTLMDQSDLAGKLKARRSFILNKFGVVDPWNKPKPDETKLSVSASDVPAVIDFENYNGPGKGLSSKEWLNKQNSADSAALIEFAKNGNLVALKNYQYDMVDKESGKVTGKASITDHPSAHIKEQWVSLVDLLTSIAYPPTDSLAMPALSGSVDSDDLASAAGFFDPTETVETVSSEHRLGFFLKVDMIEGIQELVESAKWGWISPQSKWVLNMKSAYHSFSDAMQSYISGVQGSGWVNHIWSQGKKTVKIGSFNGGAQTLAAKVYKDAVELPENVQLWRWMNDTTAGKSMTQQLIDAKPGLVLQNTNSMCASFSESWGDSSHFGQHVLMRIRCPKGAKATPSFASGNHNSEKEVTTLPGARFVVVSTKKGIPGNPNGVMVDCVMLPPHEGYVSSLKQLEALGKSIMLFFRRMFA